MTTSGRDSDPLASTMASEAGPEAADDALAAGERLGRYAIVRRLGAGAMGVVYEAHDPQLERRVAIKVVHPRRALDPTGADRLLREARALARLRHPNVVVVHDAGWAGERLFVAMELVEGTSLGDLMRAGGDRDWLALFRDAGRGLAAAHAAGILHRDFKPDNVLVAADDRVCVGDFGLAELSGQAHPDPAAPRDDADQHLTQTGALIGTPAYMAPEQHAGKVVDARADQFAFCVALWEAVYGERPFDGASLTALGDAVMAGRVRPPPRRHWLEPVLRRGLAADPAARFASMDELLRRLAPRPRRIAAIAAISGGAIVVAGVAAVLVRGDAAAPPARALAETTISANAPLTPLLAVAPDADAILFLTGDRATVIGVPDGKRRSLVAPTDTLVVGGYLQSASRAVLSVIDANGSRRSPPGTCRVPSSSRS